MAAGWWWPHKRYIIATERPAYIRRERIGTGSRYRLHCEAGPSIAWEGWELYHLHGVQVDEQIVMQPETVSAGQWVGLPNQEVRRVVAERRGWDRLMAEMQAELMDVSLDQYGRARELWRAAPTGWDEPLVMVSVANATPEPDGRHKTYWLRVPPQMTGADAAVAWTFGLEPYQYQPLMET
jgi:hypothetical protein